MSVFVDVDSFGDPRLVLNYLEGTAKAESGMKHYVAAAHALRDPEGPVLDLGCGAGHDLEILNSFGLRAIGIDPSSALLQAAISRTTNTMSGLVRATGEHLPFEDDSLGGCRIERVLLHALSPRAILVEAHRCLRAGALITVFEPDWCQFRVRDREGDQLTGWIAAMRNPGIGGDLWSLLERAGFVVHDRVEELSVWRSLATLDAVIGLAASVSQAVEAGCIDTDGAERWLDTQRAREAAGTFLAMTPKILVVASKT